MLKVGQEILVQTVRAATQTASAGTAPTIALLQRQ